MDREKPNKTNNKRKSIILLLIGLVAVVGFSVVFIGAVSGWFSSASIVLDEEYICGDECEGEFINISAAEYENLVSNEKSFIVFVDQDGCLMANMMREFVQDYVKEKGIKSLRIMFEEMKQTSLYDKVDFYPSVAIISKGIVVDWLKADSDEDTSAYNDYDEFRVWMDSYLGR